jgi:hypothetical protein
VKPAQQAQLKADRELRQLVRDEQLIAEAVAAGRVRRVPMGATSDWDDMGFRERSARMMKTAKRLKNKT